MSRLPRPPIPLEIKYRVALRQLGYQDGVINEAVRNARANRMLGKQVELHLRKLAAELKCPREQLRLDHHPALENRKKVYRHGEHVDYIPKANDHGHLRYRPHGPEFEGSHLIKTNVRGDRGQHSDRAMAAKNKNIAKNRDPNQRRVKIQSANRWPPKGSRKIQNRAR